MTNTYNRNTVRDLTPAIGSLVTVRFEELAIQARVIDAKNSWGKVRLLIEPLAGAGQQWIELGRLVADAPVVETPESMRERQEAGREQARRRDRLELENRRLYPEDYNNERSY